MSSSDDFSDFEDNPSNSLGGTDDFLNDDYGMGLDDLGGMGVSPMEKHADLLKTLTNFDKFLKDMVNGWLGLYWNEEKKEFVKDPSITPIMNVHGARWCVDLLKPYTRENNIITNIDEKSYVFIMQDVIGVMWLNLGTRAEEFGISNNGDIEKLCDQLEHSIALVLMGAGDGKYNDLLSTITTRTESVNVNNQNQNPGMQPAMGMGYPMMGQPNPMQGPGLFKTVKNKLLGQR